MKTTFPLFLLPFLLCATASGQTWNGSNGDWNVASNWAGSMLPISSSGESRVLNGNVVLTSSGETFSFYLGGHPLWSAGLASLTIKDGGAFSSNASYIGMIGNGTLNVQANSSWTIRDLGQTYIGFSAGGIGAVNVTGGGSVSSAGPTYVGYGASSSGSIRISGQNSVWTLSGNGGMTLGYLNGGTGSLTLEDGGKLTSTQSSSLVILGGSGNGTLNLGSGGAAGRLEVTEVFGATGPTSARSTSTTTNPPTLSSPASRRTMPSSRRGPGPPSSRARTPIPAAPPSAAESWWRTIRPAAPSAPAVCWSTRTPPFPASARSPVPPRSMVSMPRATASAG